MWRAGEVAAAEQAGQEPPAPRRPRSKDNEGDVGRRVDEERQRQLGQYKINGKVQPKRSPEDVDRLGVAMGFSPETKWWDDLDAFERLIEDVSKWRAGVVADAVQAVQEPPAPRRPRSKDNEGDVGRRVDEERQRQLGQYKINGKVQPKRSPEDVDRLGVAMGFSPETKWWDLDEAFERLIVDVSKWRAGVVAAAVQAGQEPPAPRRPSKKGNEGDVGGRVDNERMRQLGLKIGGKVRPKRSSEDLDRLGVAMGFSHATEWWR